MELSKGFYEYYEFRCFDNNGLNLVINEGTNDNRPRRRSLTVHTFLRLFATGPDKDLLDSPPKDPSTSLFVGWLEEVKILSPLHPERAVADVLRREHESKSADEVKKMRTTKKATFAAVYDRLSVLHLTAAYEPTDPVKGQTKIDYFVKK